MKTLDLKSIREEYNISQEDLAFKAGLTTRTIQRIENHETNPRQETLKRIADALNIKIEELFIDSNHNSKSTNEFNRIKLMKYSQFLFPFYFLGFIVPIIIKYSTKNPTSNFDKWATKIINLQFNWIILLFTTLIIMVSGVLNIIWTPLLIALSKKYELLENIKILPKNPLLKNTLFWTTYVLVVQLVGFGIFFLISILNILAIVKSLRTNKIQDFKFNTINLNLLN